MRKYEVSINDKQYSVVVKSYTQQNAELVINGKPYSVKLDAPITSTAPPVAVNSGVSVPRIQPAPQPQPAPTPPAAASGPPPSAAVAGESITAPIPGSILSILVKVGDSVSAGQTVFKMEAMKMENDINAIGSGVVKSINVSVGEAVNQGQVLMVIG